MVRLAVVALLVLLGSIARLVVLSNSLYRLNLSADCCMDTMEGPRAGEKILIFAPHEDDETLGCAGYIQQAVAAGAKVHVVLMTNGEYPEISVVLFEETLPIRPSAFIRLGYSRQRETLAAMKYLGLPDGSVTFLGYPNQYLNQMWQPSHWQPSQPVRSIRTRTTSSPYANSMTPNAVFCGQSMLEDVKTVLNREQPDVIITIQPNDVHVDHWPTYAAVRFALEELAAENVPFTRYAHVYTYLIHRDEWPAPRGYWPALNLDPPASLARLGTTMWYALPLTVAQTIDKHKATALYRSQGGSFDRLLRSFSRANELYGEQPLYVWSAETEVTTRDLLKDPPADRTGSLRDPHGDITDVRLARRERMMSITVQTRGTATGKTGYHFSLHAGDAQAANRLIAEYDWQGSAATALVLRNGILRKVNERALQVRRAQHKVTLTVPWPLNENATSYFLARAWTTRGQTIIDETETGTYLVTKASPTPLARIIHE